MSSGLAGRREERGWVRAAAFFVFAAAVLFMVGCSGDAEPTTVPTTAAAPTAAAAEPSAAPTMAAAPAAVPTAAAAPPAVPTMAVEPMAAPTAAVEPTAVPTTAAEPTAVPVAASAGSSGSPAEAAAAAVFPFERFSGLEGCASGASKDDQKAALVGMAKSFFAGNTAYDEERPRITHLGGTAVEPTARDDRRSGGIRLIIEFNGDDNGEVAEKKASLDLWMRETYNALYNAGCDLLTIVEMSGYGEALGRHPIGPAALSWAIVFKTRMTKDVAESVDWANKDNLNFDDIWETMILNFRWEQALKGGGE